MKEELAIAVAIGAAVALVIYITPPRPAVTPVKEQARPQTAIPIQRIECDKVTPAGCLRWTVYRITEQ